jgi:hypothetical protein
MKKSPTWGQASLLVCKKVQDGTSEVADFDRLSAIHNGEATIMERGDYLQVHPVIMTSFRVSLVAAGGGRLRCRGTTVNDGCSRMQKLGVELVAGQEVHLEREKLGDKSRNKATSNADDNGAKKHYNKLGGNRAEVDDMRV